MSSSEEQIVEAPGMELIAAERQRQIDAEGWTAGHDDEHENQELALAAACYALPDDGNEAEHARFPMRSMIDGTERPALWPWLPRDYKRTPHDRVRELVKAGALIAAEIDRLHRASSPASVPSPPEPCDQCGVAPYAPHRVGCFYLTGDPDDLVDAEQSSPGQAG